MKDKLIDTAIFVDFLGAGYLDCLIAATAAEHNLEVATLNVKHFQSLPGIDVTRPY